MRQLIEMNLNIYYSRRQDV